jgi:subtilisin family serine protease
MSQLESETGLGVKVAVIDSGVNPRHPHIGPIAGGASFYETSAVREGEFLDTLGHGTAVMAAIQEKAPAAEYYAAKVFHSSLATSAATLLRAIDWCIDSKMDVINLSLGTVNAAHKDAFTQAAARAHQAGCLLVAAREAQGHPCYPGCLPTVFGVGMDTACPRDAFTTRTLEGSLVFCASGFPRPVPGVPQERNLQGISFAVANMTSFIIRTLQQVGVSASSGARTSQVRESLLAAAR